MIKKDLSYRITQIRLYYYALRMSHLMDKISAGKNELKNIRKLCKMADANHTLVKDLWMRNSTGAGLYPEYIRTRTIKKQFNDIKILIEREHGL